MKGSIAGVVLTLALAIGGEACAGNTTSRIQELGLLAETNIGWVRMLSMTGAASPACASSGYFVLNLNTEAGRWAFRMLLAAQVQGLVVSVYGTGQCTMAGGSEDLRYVWYNPPTQ